jgi:hypothetical protein
MRNTIPALTALGLAVAVGPTVANAQTVISDQPVETVITQQPLRTVQTTETVRTVRPSARPVERKRVVTITRQTVVQRAVAPQPFYDVVPPAPVVTGTYAPPLYDRTYAAPLYDTTYAPPLYDTVAPAPTVDDPYVNALPPAGAAVPVYRYVYEPDRILVVDPVTNIAIQSIPR